MPPTTQNRRRRRRLPQPPQLAIDLGLLDRAEAARKLGVDPSTVWRFAVEGIETADGSRAYLNGYRFGRALFFHPTDLEQWTRDAATALRKPTEEVA